MAEAFANTLRQDEIEAFSAGVNPGKINERAIKVMAEAGIDISNHYSKSIDDLVGIDFDYVVTLCDKAKESCPVFPGKVKLIHHNFNDPTSAAGSEQEILAEFRRVRDEIKAFVKSIVL
jgi:arsenate reductase